MKELYSVNEFCEVFEITRWTFYRWVKKGYVKPIKVASKWKVRVEEIERLKKGEK